MKLYEIESRLRALCAVIDLNGGEITDLIQADLEALEMAKEEKIESILAIRQEEASIQVAYRNEIERLKNLETKSKRKVDNLMRYLLHVTDPTYKQQTSLGKFYWKESVVTEVELEAVPESYRVYKESWTPNKAKAKEGYKNGDTVPGFSFVKNYHAQLR